MNNKKRILVRLERLTIFMVEQENSLENAVSYYLGGVPPAVLPPRWVWPTSTSSSLGPPGLALPQPHSGLLELGGRLPLAAHHHELEDGTSPGWGEVLVGVAEPP